jgi:prepilin-type N-terminal cleavage/methylation domain-containing protein
MATRNNRPGTIKAFFSVRGFTLIELMIVMVLAGILIAVVGPRVTGGLLGLTTRTAALKTAAMLRYARSIAVNSGCGYHVVFDGTKRRVILLQARQDDEFASSSIDTDMDEGWFDRDDDVSEPEEADFDRMRASEPEKKIYLLPDGVFFENVIIDDVDSEDLGDEMIMMLTFQPNGMSLGASITIADERERRYFITVEPVIGSVRVDEEEEDD